MTWEVLENYFYLTCWVNFWLNALNNTRKSKKSYFDFSNSHVTSKHKFLLQVKNFIINRRRVLRKALEKRMATRIHKYTKRLRVMSSITRSMSKIFLYSENGENALHQRSGKVS